MGFLISRIDTNQDEVSRAMPSHQSPVLFAKVLPSTTKQDILTRYKAEEYQSYVEIAVDVLKKQDRFLIDSLKDFLTCLPNPMAIETVLAASIYCLAETDSQSCRWVLRHPDYLMPELDLVALAHQIVCTKLQNQEAIVQQDFSCKADGTFRLDDRAKEALCADNSVGDRLLLEEILHIDCSLNPREYPKKFE